MSHKEAPLKAGPEMKDCPHLDVETCCRTARFGGGIPRSLEVGGMQHGDMPHEGMQHAGMQHG